MILVEKGVHRGGLMAVGEFVTGKFTWLLDGVEIVGVVEVVEDDDVGIEPLPNYRHLIGYFRGNNPLLWSSSGTPGRMHCETYPLDPTSINRDQPWPLQQKPAGQPFQVKTRTGTRDLRVGDTVALVGRWVIDHHPEYCDLSTKFTPPELSRCHARGWLRVGPTHTELHPFRWDDIRLVEPLAPGEPATAVVSLAAPLHEEQYLGGGKWLANELAGVAGKVFLADDPEGTESNFHTQVRATVELDPPPRPEPFDPAMRTIWTEEVRALGLGMTLDQVRSVQRRPDGGITVQAVIDARQADRTLPSIYNPGNNLSVFQARYELRWGRVTGNDAQYVGQVVPARLEAGQSQVVTVTMRNTGTTVWPAGAAHRLGSQDPQDNSTWGLSRAPVVTQTPPGAMHEFRITITAPRTSGRYPFRWRMLEELVQWFGDLTPARSIEVVPAGGRTIVPDVQEFRRNAAAKKVRDAGLVPAFTGSTSAAAWVDSQSPPADTEVDAGSTVQMHCRTGPIP
jgi:hypothetical protein